VYKCDYQFSSSIVGNITDNAITDLAVGNITDNVSTDLAVGNITDSSENIVLLSHPLCYPVSFYFHFRNFRWHNGTMIIVQT
jgi:hypothetical protein